MIQQIEIKNPFHEDWDVMKATTDGRFCLTCKETVIDFSNKSTNEIASILKTNSVCPI